jgi:hypothetical protein
MQEMLAEQDQGTDDLIKHEIRLRVNWIINSMAHKRIKKLTDITPYDDECNAVNYCTSTSYTVHSIEIF